MLALALLFVLGLTSQAYFTLNVALVMLATKTGMYGRVSSIQDLTWAVTPVSMLGIGAMVDFVGVSWTTVGLGLLLAALFVIVGACRLNSWRKPA